MSALSFAHLRSTRPRREKLRGVVLHWTGGAGSPEAVYRVLRARTGPRTPDGLSVHYIVGADGEVLQTAPADLVCLHAGPANEWSIGIEIVSPGIPKGPAHEREVRNGVLREVYADRLKTSRPRGVQMLDFTAAQTSAVTLLLEQLCDAHGIPRRVPTGPDGALLRRELTAVELDAFAGVLGHYHCHTTKLDPGTRLLDRLRVRWGG